MENPGSEKDGEKWGKNCFVETLETLSYFCKIKILFISDNAKFYILTLKLVNISSPCILSQSVGL